jgi:hypothetical protein
MVSIFAEAVFKSHVHHFPEEIYRYIVEYLLPKNLQSSKEVRKFNKVLHYIPRFEKASPHSIRSTYYVATRQHQFVKYIYRIPTPSWSHTVRRIPKEIQCVYQVDTGRSYNILEADYNSYLVQNHETLNLLQKNKIIYGTPSQTFSEPTTTHSLPSIP